MERHTRKKIALLTLGCFLLFGVFGCGGKDDTAKKEESSVPVDAETIEIQDFDKAVTVGGLVAAQNAVNILPKVSGMEQIKSVNVKVGDQVKQGQILAQLDTSSSQINVNNAQLGVESAQTSVAVAQQAYDNAQKSYENGQELYAAGAISQSDLDQLKLARENAWSQLRSAQIGVSNAQNGLSSAEMAQGFSTITSPINGVITMVNANVGSFATASAPMFEVSDISKLKVTAGVNESSVSKIKRGQEVLLKVAAVSDEWISGKITEIGRAMNPQTKNYPVAVAINAEVGKMSPGMYAEMEMVVDHVDDAIVIPVEAIVYKDTQPVCYVIDDENRVKEVKLELGMNDGNFYVVTKGLYEGDQIVVKGNRNLVDGEKITLIHLDGEEQILNQDKHRKGSKDKTEVTDKDSKEKAE